MGRLEGIAVTFFWYRQEEMQKISDGFHDTL